MTIPEIRCELHDLANALGGAIGARLAFLAEETKRRPAVRRTRARRHKVSKGEVLRYLAKRPDADYEEIATAYNSNVGRVSEALQGKRT